MEYRKDRNFIVAYDGENVRGKWNILTNEFIGVKGGVVKTRPASFNYGFFRDREDSIGYAFRFVDSLFHYHGRRNFFTAEIGQFLESLISVGLCIKDEYAFYWDLDEYKVRLTKDCVKFIKDNYNGIYSCLSVTNYKIHKKYPNLEAVCNGNYEWARECVRSVKDNVPSDFAIEMIKRAIHEKVFKTYSGSGLAQMINEWYEIITAMGDKLEVKHNILTNYTILKWVYDEFKTAHYDEMLEHHNNKEWLYFEDENYIVRPLLTRKAFHEEAKNQHNCVERMYMEAVAQGTTHVVTVRKKSDPAMSYITCEVNNNGCIIQYLLRFNRRPTEEADYTFQKAYASHLMNNHK